MKKQKGIRHQRNRAQKEAKRNAVVAAKKKEQAAAFLSPIHQARAAASVFGVSYCMVTEGKALSGDHLAELPHSALSGNRRIAN